MAIPAVTHLDFSIAFAARWCQELFEAVLAVQVSLLFNEADVDEFTLAAGVDAQEVGWAPGLAQSCDEWTSENVEILLKPSDYHHLWIAQTFFLSQALQLPKDGISC